jgi:hypothetical protein
LNGCLLAGWKALRDARPLFENSTVCQVVDAIWFIAWSGCLPLWWVVGLCGGLVWLIEGAPFGVCR